MGVFSSFVTRGQFTGLVDSESDDVYVGQQVEMLVEGFICCLEMRLDEATTHVMQALHVVQFPMWPAGEFKDTIAGEGGIQCCIVFRPFYF